MNNPLSRWRETTVLIPSKLMKRPLLLWSPLAGLSFALASSSSPAQRLMWPPFASWTALILTLRVDLPSCNQSARYKMELCKDRRPRSKNFWGIIDSHKIIARSKNYSTIDKLVWCILPSKFSEHKSDQWWLNHLMGYACKVLRENITYCSHKKSKCLNIVYFEWFAYL